MNKITIKRTRTDSAVFLLELCVVLFYLIRGTVKFHVRKIGTPIGLDISNNIHVDNVSLGAKSVEEACKIYLESKEILEKPR